MFPPPLAWLPSYAKSMQTALGCSVDVQVRPARVPLLYRVVFTFGEPLSGWAMMQTWNLFQMYAATNDCVPQGRVEREGRSLTVEVATKRRLGEPRDDHPAAKEVRSTA